MTFVVEGVEDVGRTELGSFATSAAAVEFLIAYIGREDAGGWNLIEIYDLRGEPERIAFWEREN